MLRLYNNTYYINTIRILVNEIKVNNILSKIKLDNGFSNVYPILINQIGYTFENTLYKNNFIYTRRHRGGKVANKMRVLEKRKRREQEKLAKLSQNTSEFIKFSKDVKKPN